MPTPHRDWKRVIKSQKFWFPVSQSFSWNTQCEYLDINFHKVKVVYSNKCDADRTAKDKIILLFI